VIITQYGGAVFFTVALSLDQWFWSLLFGIGDLIYAQVTHLSYYVTSVFCLLYQVYGRLLAAIYRWLAGGVVQWLV